MPYLNCPHCRLSLNTAAVDAIIEHCPRCEARLGEVRRLFLSPLPHRLMPPAARLAAASAETPSPHAVA
jgi:uncharacterized paraquat-inducible protein A